MTLIDITDKQDFQARQRLELAEAVIEDQAARIRTLESLLKEVAKSMGDIVPILNNCP